ncbi:MAG: S-layer homology domain-containing protein [Candidatus Margulisiibacteriota bacterium]
MRKVTLCLFLLVFVLAGSALADIKFTDVPNDHWAASSVYDLVNMGVTAGYPDGTFRGNHSISRYEAAVFLAKLGDKLGAVDLTEIQGDIQGLKADVAALKKNPSAGGISGVEVVSEVSAMGKMGNLIAEHGSRGPVMCYRLISDVAKDFGDGNAVAVNLDTMDSGYAGGSQDLATQLLDVQGRMRVKNIGTDAPLDLLLTLGPGPIEHIDRTGILTCETGEYFIRPYSGVTANTRWLGLDLMAKVWADSIATSGYFNSTGVAAGLDYNAGNWLPYLKNVKIGIADSYLRTAGGTNTDNKIGLLAMADIFPKVKTGLQFNAAGNTSSKLMVGANLILADVWNTGTLIDISAVKIGSEYLNTNFNPTLAGYDVFNRAYVNSVVDIGGKLIQAINDDLLFKGVGDLKLSSDFGYGPGKTNSSLTVQGGLTYKVAPAAALDAAYRIYQNPNAASNPTSDMAVLGLTYKF